MSMRSHSKSQRYEKNGVIYREDHAQSIQKSREIRNEIEYGERQKDEEKGREDIEADAQIKYEMSLRRG